MIQRVADILRAVQTPPAASVREPVAPLGANTSVSDVIEMVTVPAPKSLTKVSVVPIGNATDALAGIVHVRAEVSATGW